MDPLKVRRPQALHLLHLRGKSVLGEPCNGSDEAHKVQACGGVYTCTSHTTQEKALSNSVVGRDMHWTGKRGQKGQDFTTRQSGCCG